MKRLSCFLMILVVACFSAFAHAEEAKKPVIVCSLPVLADFVKQVVGDDCEVKSLMEAGVDPHEYQPKPADAGIIKSADLCVENGLHMEGGGGNDWMAIMAKDAGKPLVTATDGIKPLELDEDGKMVDDPHAWHSPKTAAIYLNNILKGVSKLVPEKKFQFDARADLYLQELKILDGWIKKQVNLIPPSKRILVTNHDALGYFCHEFGFKVAAPLDWKAAEESGMSPGARAKVVNFIKNFHVKAIFMETTLNPKTMNELGKEAGVGIAGTLYADQLGPAGSDADTYIGMMRENTLTIVEALK
ncbi:MAG: metal ABC transporter solute-binding protein, Zn/Mn family [Desulfomonilaceae bacterium]